MFLPPNRHSELEANQQSERWVHRLFLITPATPPLITMALDPTRSHDPRKLSARRRLPCLAKGIKGGTLRPIAAWTTLLLSLNLSWRIVRYGVAFPVWGDEAFVAVNLVTKTFDQLAQPLDHYQIVPLLFLWSEWTIAKIFGYGELALRLIPFLAGVGSLYLFYHLAFVMLGGYRALAALAIFAASFYPVRHAAEIKPYSTDLLIAVILLGIAWKLKSTSKGYRQWITLIFVSAVGIWASYPAVFIVGGILLTFGITALRARSTKSVGIVFTAGIIAVLSFSAMYATIGRAQAAAAASLVTSKTWSFAFPPVTEPWRLLAWFLDVHTGNMLAYPNGGNHGGSTATFLLCLMGISALLRRRRELVLLLLSPLPLMFVAAAFYRYPYGGSVRAAIHLAPMVCLLAGSGLVALLTKFLNPKTTLRVLYSVCGISCFFIAGAIAADFVRPFKNESDLRDRQIVQLLASATGKNDLWVVFGDTRNHPHVPNLIHWGGSAARVRFNILRYVKVPVFWGASPVDLPQRKNGDIWLIVYKDNQQQFPESLKNRYVQRFEERFGMPTLDRYPIDDKRESILVYRFRYPR